MSFQNYAKIPCIKSQPQQVTSKAINRSLSNTHRKQSFNSFIFHPIFLSYIEDFLYSS